MGLLLWIKGLVLVRAARTIMADCVSARQPERVVGGYDTVFRTAGKP
jgi:hypothetical protein